MDHSLQPLIRSEHGHYREHSGQFHRLRNAVPCPIRRSHDVRWRIFIFQEPCPIRQGNGGAGDQCGACRSFGRVYNWNFDPLPAVGMGRVGHCGLREQTLARSTCYVCRGVSQALPRIEETDSSRGDEDSEKDQEGIEEIGVSASSVETIAKTI